MPRKQNGFGNAKSFTVPGVNKISHRTDKGKGAGAAGRYPSNRGYGSTVTRSVIEQWDLESSWAQWRRGMEYYYQAAYLDFQETNAVLYQGTATEIPVTFSGYRFATKNADSRTHYAIQRTIDQNKILGYVQDIYNDPLLYGDQFNSKEVWLKVIAGRDISSDAALLRSVGERISNGSIDANIKGILTSNQLPALYIGKSGPEGVQVRATVPLSEVNATEYVQKNGIQSLVGKYVYQPDFYTERPITPLDQFIDADDAFFVTTSEIIGGMRISILDNNTVLPPSLGEIADTVPIYSTTNQGTSTLVGSFGFPKAIYQKYYKQKYMTADVVRGEVANLSYAIMPYEILGVKEDPAINKLEIISRPFQSTLTLTTPVESQRFIILSDNGFTKTEDDFNADGSYNHKPEKPGDKLWKKISLDVNPWMDQTFQANDRLTFADLYTCSCPSYLHGKIRNPEATDDNGRKINRQSRVPMPTATGAGDVTNIGILKVAGIIDSWATSEYKRGFKICKHTIASMFINKIRVEEPNTFPSSDTRDKFETKLAKDIQEVAEEFNAQLKRSEITTVEIVYALAEALNLDDVELGYVMQTASF